MAPRKMERTFQYFFTPKSADPVGAARVHLSIREIEDAALLEILQTPGAGLATWSLLDKLLTSTGPNTPFIFREPLGQAREVKVALSGLFDRFVARAYLKRYFRLNVFNHLSASGMVIDAKRRIAVRRRARGDLPDWVACSAGHANLTIAEAKGCHDRPGPAKALARAWTQTQRVDVTRKGVSIAIKRIAIATRWGSAKGGSSTPIMSVQDPDESGVPLTPEEERALYVGILRKHLASLLVALGHIELGQALLRLTSSRQPEKSLISAAAQTLAITPVSTFPDHAKFGDLQPLIGGTTTRQGVVSNRRTSPGDEQALVRLELRPQFVGVDRSTVKAAIMGENLQVPESVEIGELQSGRARGDGAGGWIVPLFPVGDDEAED